MTDFRYLIVGGGMVADAAARGIRQIDADGSIGIVSEETDRPYARPALSRSSGPTRSSAGTRRSTCTPRRPGRRSCSGPW